MWGCRPGWGWAGGWDPTALGPSFDGEESSPEQRGHAGLQAAVLSPPGPGRCSLLLRPSRSSSQLFLCFEKGGFEKPASQPFAPRPTSGSLLARCLLSGHGWGRVFQGSASAVRRSSLLGGLSPSPPGPPATVGGAGAGKQPGRRPRARPGAAAPAPPSEEAVPGPGAGGSQPLGWLGLVRCGRMPGSRPARKGLETPVLGAEGRRRRTAV